MPTPLRPGDPAPDFAGVTTEGKRVALKDFRGRKLVLYFLPVVRIGTPPGSVINLVILFLMMVGLLLSLRRQGSLPAQE